MEVKKWLMDEKKTSIQNKSANVHAWNFMQKEEVLYNILPSNECFSFSFLSK